MAGPVRDVLRAAALLGTDFAVSDLAIVLGRGVPDLIPAIDEACAAGVLAESGQRLGFRHPLIRAALYDDMPAALRAAWHRDAAHALAESGAPPDRVARQMLGATAGLGGSAEPMDERMLTWLAGAAEPLVGQAPGVAAELLTRAVASVPAGSAQHGWLASRLADALYRIGDLVEAERVANLALDYATDPDLIVELHWTLAQCRMVAGSSAESLGTLDRALAAPGITARHRARLLVLAARTHSNFGEVEKAGQAATSALAAATEADDNWSMGWALHVLTLVTTVQGRMTDALPLFDRALAVTQADPALTDLRLLLQINKAVTLGCLDQYEQAFAAAGQARELAGQVGTAIRLAQAHSALSELRFATGRWDEVLAEMEMLQETLKEATVACVILGVAAMIRFHRGEIEAARSHLEAAVPHAKRIGHRQIGPLALARSLDCEQAGAPQEALAALTAAFEGNAEDLGEVEDLLGDAVRLAIQAGDQGTAKALAGHVDALAAGSEIPHRQANALYCRGLLDRDAPRLLAAAERYHDASGPAAGQGAGGGGRALRRRRRQDPGAGRVHRRRGCLHLAGRGRRHRPGAGRVPRPRHPARAARQAPAGAERLGQPHGDRDQDRRVRRGGLVQPGDRGPAAAIPPDRCHARLAHPQEAQRQLADRHRQGVSPAHHLAEVTQPGSEVTRPGKQTSPGTPRPGRGVPGEFGGNCEAPG